MASYDEIGAVAKSAYVLEKGKYAFYVGENVSVADKVDSLLLLWRSGYREDLSKVCAEHTYLPYAG